jgi:hypothetical protein
LKSVSMSETTGDKHYVTRLTFKLGIQWSQCPKFLPNMVQPCFYVAAIYVFPPFATLFQVSSIPYIHNALFTSILHFQNFKFHAIYIFRVLTEGTVDIKWRLLTDCLYLHVLSCTTIAIRWSAIQLQQLCILLYRMKMVFLVWQS